MTPYTPPPALPAARRQQQTIAGTAQVHGFGYWSGRDICVEFRPAPPDTGVVFVRSDLPGQPRIPARVQHRVEIPRRTTLAYHDATVEMVEHIMAALAGLQVDNCEVWVDAQEMPGCDGSSLAFVEALNAVGVQPQAALRSQLVVDRVIRVGDQQCWVEAHPVTDPCWAVQYHLDYGPRSPIPGGTFGVPALTPARFRQELAPARTFLLAEEAAWLRSQGLGTRVGPHDLLVFDQHGPLDNPLRYHDECVRHKTLDLIGDLALAGCDLVGRFVAHRSGHRLNAELTAAVLRSQPSKHQAAA